MHNAAILPVLLLKCPRASTPSFTLSKTAQKTSFNPYLHHTVSSSKKNAYKTSSWHFSWWLVLFNTAHLSATSQAARTNRADCTQVYFCVSPKEQQQQQSLSFTFSLVEGTSFHRYGLPAHTSQVLNTYSLCSKESSVRRSHWLQNKSNGNNLIIFKTINSTSSCELCRLSTPQLTELCWKITYHMKPWL